ncbi:MAG: hypothetical protein IJ647_02855 [Prevotella sp.]|nr:hypothetical protein [Prevotella sp.]
MKKLNSDLRNDAISFGLCDQWQGDWKNDWDREKLVAKMYQGMDFCLKYRYPSKQFILDNFEQEFRRKSCVLVDDKYSLLNPQNALLLGNSESTIRMNAHNSATIYMRDESHVKLFASGLSFVIVHLLESAQVEVETKDNAHVVVITHSKFASLITGCQDVVYKEEYDWLK